MTFIECGSVAALGMLKSLENSVAYNKLKKYTLYTRLMRVFWRKHVSSICIRKEQSQREGAAGSGARPGARAVLAAALPSHIPGPSAFLSPASSLPARSTQLQPVPHTFGLNCIFSLRISAEMSGPDTTVLNVKRAKNNVQSQCNSVFNLGSVKARSRKEWRFFSHIFIKPPNPAHT